MQSLLRMTESLPKNSQVFDGQENGAVVVQILRFVTAIQGKKKKERERGGYQDLLGTRINFVLNLLSG